MNKPRKLLKLNIKKECVRKHRFMNVLLLLGVWFMGVQNVGAAGLLSPRDGSAALELAEQHVEVMIENGYAVTQVEQVFRNPHAQDADGIYSFPVPEGAAVGEFTYWIDGVPVQAEVLEKEAARKLHEAEKQQGRETALVEQDAYRSFDVEVSPIRAGQDVRIRLVYLQQQSVDHSMGRYVYPLEEGGVDQVRDQFWARNEQIGEAFTFRLHLRSAYPVDAVRVPNGHATVKQLDSGEWVVTIDAKTGQGDASGEGLSVSAIENVLRADEIILESEQAGVAANQSSGSSAHGSGFMYKQQAGNANATVENKSVFSLDHDIIVYWRLAENLPGAVDLVTYRESGKANGTFMLTLTPGIDLAPITEGRDWIFVLDTSGSMEGKFTALVDGVRGALTSLNQADRFKIILFSDSASTLTNGFESADTASVNATLEKLDQLRAGGSTNLFDGLKQAVKSLDADRTTAVLLVTDGVANVGPTELRRFMKLMEPMDIRLFTAVMGNSANRPLLEGLTRYSEGFAVNVSNDDDMVGLMLQMTSKVTHEALHKVRLSIIGVRTRDVTPEKFSRVYRGEQLVIFGRYSGDGIARIRLDTEISGEEKHYESELLFPENATENPELERLWAFATIEELKAQQDIIGKTDDSRQAITDMALSHGLVTDYTSLVVVRDEVFQQQGIDRRNATRVERERQARQVRSAQPTAHTRQDTNTPAFPSQRHTTSNGGGALGGWILMVLLLLAMLRIGLGLHDRVNDASNRQ
ncbi:MAG: VIT and VWA domain-containing protein [Granulosicoccus sp.]